MRARTPILVGLVVVAAALWAWSTRARPVARSESAKEGESPTGSAPTLLPGKRRLASHAAPSNSPSPATPPLGGGAAPGSVRAIHGRVIDLAGAAVPAALVTLGRVESAPSWGVGKVATTRADALGVFTAELPDTPASQSLWIVASSDDGTASTPRHVPLSPAESEATLVVTGSSLVEGEVRPHPSELGKEVWVEAWGDLMPESPDRRRLEVGADGRFRISGVTDSLFIQAYCPGRVPSKAWSALLTSSSREHPVLELGGEPRVVTVRVTCDDGKPLPEGLEVFAGDKGRFLQPYQLSTEGTALVRDLDPAVPVAVSFQPTRDGAGRWWALQQTARREWGPALESQGFRMVLECGANPTFRLVGGGALPAAGVRLVFSDGANGVTDEAGRWTPSTYTPIKPGPYELRLEGDPRPIWKGVLTAAREGPDIDVSVPDRRVLEVVVETAVRERLTSEGFDVELDLPPAQRRSRQGRGLADNAALTPAGVAALFAGPDLFASGVVAVRTGEWSYSRPVAECLHEDGRLILRLPSDALGALRGNVRYPHAKASRVYVEVKGIDLKRQLESDENGNCAPCALPPGVYEVSAAVRDVLVAGPVRVEVVGGKTAEFALELGPKTPPK